MPKYSLIKCEDSNLYRVKAEQNFGLIRKGAIGGFVSGYHNMSLNERAWCWIYDDAKVIDDALLWSDAHIYDNVIVKDNALVLGHAKLYHNVVVKNFARVAGYTKIYNNAVIKEHAFISGDIDIVSSPIIGEKSVLSSKKWEHLII